MSLTPGTRLGPYEIVTPLGAGGMGEVYRAKDTRLGREVAIKVLPAAVAEDAERMARFEREARLLASLNHPNIAAIHGFEVADAARALVMEIVEGPTLADRIAQGAIPLDDALPIAAQIAEALEFAHDHGIVHRDLKPANVKLRPDGTVKVLDFGLAKAMEEEAAQADLSRSPTLTQRMTGAGVIIGTAAYMSPEQAKGKGVDRRADIWAFGVVLFEILTGRQLFQGETASETLASVIKDEVPWSALPAGTPPRVRRLLERCLTRDPRQRLQAIGEARIALSGSAVDDAPASAPAAGAQEPARSRGRVALAVGAAIALAAVSFATAWNLRDRGARPAETRMYSLAINPLSVAVATDATISPDGRHVAFYADGKLYARNLTTLETRELCEAQTSAMRPFWSPDSRQVGFTDGGRLLRIPVDGGGMSLICTPPVFPSGGTSACWTPGGKAYFTLGNMGLFEVNANGGEPREIVPVDSASNDFHEAFALPGGRAVLFVRHLRTGGPCSLALFDGKAWREIFHATDATVWRPAWSPTGHILFHRIGAGPGLWALPFSLDKLAVTGDPILVASDGMNASIADDGTLVYSRGLLSRSVRAVRIDRSGAITDTLTDSVEDAITISLSPDGRRAALSMMDKGNSDIYVLDLERRTRTRLTFDRGGDYEPVWSADGSRIYYTNTSASEPQIHSVAPGGGGESVLPVTRGSTPAIGPDGSTLAFTRHSTETGDDLFLQQGTDSTTALPLVAGPAIDTRPDISPDGRFIAYESVESARNEVFLMHMPPGTGRWQVSTHGGRRPRWSSDGRTLFYQSFDTGSVYEVHIDPGNVPTIDAPRHVFDLASANIKPWGGRNYDSRDGQKFVALVLPSQPNIVGNVTLVENWFEGFRDR